MPDPVPGSRFRIYDILTRIVPGTLFVVLTIEISSHFPGSTGTYSPIAHILSSTAALLIYLGLGLVFGELIQLIRGRFHPVPYPFRRLLFHQSGDRDFLATHDKYRLEFWDWLSAGYSGMVFKPVSNLSPTSWFSIKNSVSTNARIGFWNDFKYKFGIDDDFNEAVDVYGLLVGYMEPRMTSDLMRYRAVVDFMSNLSMVTLWLAYTGIFAVSDYRISGPTIAGFVFLILFSLLPLVSLFGLIEREYINRLILEYLLARKEENNGSRLS